MKYSPITMNYFNNPVNVGRLNDSSAKHVLYGSPYEHLLISFDVVVENNLVKDAKFKAYGGVNVIAGACYITDFVKGKGVNDIKAELDMNYLISVMKWDSKDLPIALALVEAIHKVL